MTTQAKNIARYEGSEAMKNGLERAAQAASGTIESFVESLHSAAAPVSELTQREPLLKAVAVGYTFGVLTVLLSLLAAKLP